MATKFCVCKEILKPIIISGQLKFRCSRCGKEYMPNPEDTLLIDKEAPKESDQLRNLILMAKYDNTNSVIYRYCPKCKKKTAHRSLILGESHQSVLLCGDCSEKS